MSTWYIVILLTVYGAEPQNRMHIIFEPNFQSAKECTDYAESQEGLEFIVNHLVEEYGMGWALKQVHCGHEEAVLKALGVKVTAT